jgi:hypothetical protein
LLTLFSPRYPFLNSDESDVESDSISEDASNDEDSDEINEIYKNESTAAVGVSLAVIFIMEDTENDECRAQNDESAYKSV